jgi:acyl dehydratase
MAWACIAIGEQWAVTTETTARFHRVIRIGHRYRVEAYVVDHVDDLMRTRAEVVGGRGEIRAEAEARFTTLGAAQVTRLSGVEVGAANRRFVND